jgi:hypothetical protein
MCKFLGSEVPRAASLLVRVGGPNTSVASLIICGGTKNLHMVLVISLFPWRGEISYCRVSVFRRYS